jgi:hypothetical protein
VYIICPEEVQETSGGWDMAVSGNWYINRHFVVSKYFKEWQAWQFFQSGRNKS